jgi:cytochrome c553
MPIAKNAWCAVLIIASTGSLGWAAATNSSERPLWAYPTLAASNFEKSPVPMPSGPQQLPGSARQYSLKEAETLSSTADWYPERHLPMPDIVASGAANGGFACGSCHMPNGFGHAESSSLVGLSPEYFIEAMREFRSGERNEPVRMNIIAKATSDADTRQAASWFASLKTEGLPWTKVVETATVPKTYLGVGRMRFIDPDTAGQREPLGQRIIEIPQDAAKMRFRDPSAAFIAYVPIGALGRGQALVETGSGRTLPCAACHGARLQGVGNIPPIAGNHPLYLVRQLFDFRSGDRKGKQSELMKPVVNRLTDQDIIDIAAYLGSRRF